MRNLAAITASLLVISCSPKAPPVAPPDAGTAQDLVAQCVPATLSLPDLHKAASTVAPADKATALRLAARSCVDFYSSKLAVSDDPADAVAQATVALCEDTIRWSEAATDIEVHAASMPSSADSDRPYLDQARARVVETRACFKHGPGWLAGSPFGQELKSAADQIPGN